QLISSELPPRRLTDAILGTVFHQLAPRQPEKQVRLPLPEKLRVQLAHEAEGLALIHHETEIQIAGRLRDLVDVLLVEDLEGRPHLVQQRSDVAPNEAHHRARPDLLGAAVAAEVLEQRIDARGIEGVRHRIEGYGDVRL